jgi:hypothetical protein
MAKKSRLGKLIEHPTVKKIWKLGVIQSLSFNMLLLLILGLIITNIDNKTYPIHISFEPNVEEIMLEEISNISIEVDGVDTEIVANTLDIPTVDEKHIIDIPNPEIQEIVFDGVEEAIDVEELGHTYITENKTVNTVSGRNGSGDDFERRLKAAGAQTGDIQISIAWNNLNDIDVGVILETEAGLFKINYRNKIGPNMGQLDVDMNVMPITVTPVENIFWPKNQAPKGNYLVYVHHYHQWCPIDETSVHIRIKIDGKQIEKQTIVSRQQGYVEVFKFTYGL